MNYTVPGYYKNFQCKCSECRHSCCDGWPIRITGREYYHLLGTDCSAKLRSRLDCALKVCPDQGSGTYAEIGADWCGICMLHREDGLCAIQAELGEGSLPDVCRLYPRNTRRLVASCECSCSNSCEKVVELLMELREPLSFEETDLPFVPKFESKTTSEQYRNCEKSISILQDRSFTLPERLLSLGNYLNVLKPTTDNSCRFPQGFSYKFSYTFQLMFQIARYYEDSNSVGEYCIASLDYYKATDERIACDTLPTVSDKYIAASEQLDTLLPDWQLLIEQLLVNHMFYNSFPYYDSQRSETASYLSLIAMYSFLRFNLLSLIINQPSQAELVDFFAAMFRLIEHSNFRAATAAHMRAEKIPVQEFVPELIYF